MDKKLIIQFFGSVTEVARVVGVSHAAVVQWPDDLPKRIADRVIGAMHRQGKKVPKEWLKAG
jgi:hypothetical protein